jgi:hypothetical protein
MYLRDARVSILSPADVRAVGQQCKRVRGVCVPAAVGEPLALRALLPLASRGGVRPPGS